MFKKKGSKTLFSKFSPQQSLLLLLLLLRLAVFRGETFDWRLHYTFALQTKTTHLNATFLACFCFLPFFSPFATTCFPHIFTACCYHFLRRAQALYLFTPSFLLLFGFCSLQQTINQLLVVLYVSLFFERATGFVTAFGCTVSTALAGPLSHRSHTLGTRKSRPNSRFFPSDADDDERTSLGQKAKMAAHTKTALASSL